MDRIFIPIGPRMWAVSDGGFANVVYTPLASTSIGVHQCVPGKDGLVCFVRASMVESPAFPPSVLDAWVRHLEKEQEFREQGAKMLNDVSCQRSPSEYGSPY